MSTRLELPAALPSNLLEGRRPPRLTVDGEARSTILALAQLVDRGECLQAAAQAAELLRDDVYDLRLASVYLVGLFVERGVAYLPELLRSTRALLAHEAAAPATLRSPPRVLDATVQWLLQSLSTHIEFHAQRRDETWTQWLEAGDLALPVAVRTEADALARVLGELVERPSSGAVLGKIGRWVSGDLARALARTAKEAAARAEAAEAEREQEVAAREHDDEADVDDRGHAHDEHDAYDDRGLHEHEHDDRDGHEHDDPYDDHDPHEHDGPFDHRHPFDHHPVDHHALDHRHPFDHDRRASPRPPTPPNAAAEPESPALASLRRKLHGFARLVERGELAKAAIIARDVQRIIESFDPVEFLPSLFAGYFRAMNQRLDELLPHLDAGDGTRWQVLSRLYQADLEGFVED